MQFIKRYCEASFARAYKHSFTTKPLTNARTRKHMYHPSWNPISKTWLFKYNQSKLEQIHVSEMTTLHKKRVILFMKNNGYKIPPELEESKNAPSKNSLLSNIKAYVNRNSSPKD